MSRLVCECGHVIVDQRDFLPYKATFYSDQDTEACFDELVQDIAKFIEAREQGRQDEFLEGDFSKNYPKNLNLSSIINDIMIGYEVAFGRTMYECEQCGRLWMQTEPGTNEYVSYLPEGGMRGIPRSPKKRKALEDKSNYSRLLETC
jgi:hypothetical protein